jgi:hypothetical protein
MAGDLPAIIYVAMTRLITGVKDAESSRTSNYTSLHLYCSQEGECSHPSGLRSWSHECKSRRYMTAATLELSIVAHLV